MLTIQFSFEVSQMTLARLTVICKCIFLSILKVLVCIRPYSIEINYLHNNFTFTAELQTVSDQYHRFDSNNGQVDVPPRYSDLYPRINSLDRTSTQRGRTSTTDSVGSRSLSSFTRNSASRMSIRRGLNSGSLPREQNNESGANQTKEPLPKHPDIIVESDQANEPVITSTTVTLNIDTTNQPAADEDNTHL